MTVVLVTGVMASGKSTVADALAWTFPRAVHVRGDVFRRFVVAGRADPTPPVTDEQLAQLRLRYRLGASTADTYAAAGFTVVVQDIVVGPVLADVVAMFTAEPLYVVVLDPDAEVVAARESQRAKTGYGAGWDPGGLVDTFRSTTPRLGLWLDTGALTVDETVAAIRSRLAEARVR